MSLVKLARDNFSKYIMAGSILQESSPEFSKREKRFEELTKNLEPKNLKKGRLKFLDKVTKDNAQEIFSKNESFLRRNQNEGRTALYKDVIEPTKKVKVDVPIKTPTAAPAASVSINKTVGNGPKTAVANNAEKFERIGKGTGIALAGLTLAGIGAGAYLYNKNKKDNL